MSEGFSVQYQEEIRDYLLGRLAREHTTGKLLPVSDELPTPPILSWWIFEGRRYRGLEQCLALELDRMLRQAVRLRATYNPHWRYVQAPEGDVDWVATAFLSATSGSPEYVCKTSKVGLSSEEQAALDGWLLWLGRLWAGYVQEVNPPPGAPQFVPWEVIETAPPALRQLQRWAYVAKRSRWPLLRNVVAETLRRVFEPHVLDAVPLPSDHATLFELVCIVRILQALEPAPREIRWIDLDAGQNTISTSLGTVHFQLTVKRSQVLAGSPFDQASAEGVQRFGVSIPGRIDGLFRFKRPWNGFAGILLEAKSGMQGPEAALFQLLCYARALSREGMGPLLVLGVSEADTVNVPGHYALSQQTAGGRDVWVFSCLRNLREELKGVKYAFSS